MCTTWTSKCRRSRDSTTCAPTCPLPPKTSADPADVPWSGSTVARRGEKRERNERMERNERRDSRGMEAFECRCRFLNRRERAKNNR